MIPIHFLNLMWMTDSRKVQFFCFKGLELLQNKMHGQVLIIGSIGGLRVNGWKLHYQFVSYVVCTN